MRISNCVQHYFRFNIIFYVRRYLRECLHGIGVESIENRLKLETRQNIGRLDSAEFKVFGLNPHPRNKYNAHLTEAIRQLPIMTVYEYYYQLSMRQFTTRSRAMLMGAYIQRCWVSVKNPVAASFASFLHPPTALSLSFQMTRKPKLALESDRYEVGGSLIDAFSYWF